MRRGAGSWNAVRVLMPDAAVARSVDDARRRPCFASPRPAPTSMCLWSPRLAATATATTIQTRTSHRSERGLRFAPFHVHSVWFMLYDARMEADRFQRAERIFHEALALASSGRHQYIEQAAGGDGDLVDRVHRMIVYTERTMSSTAMLLPDAAATRR